MTSNLAARMARHRAGTGSAFCRRYGLQMLVLAEQHASIDAAIGREKAMKAWRRDWKIRAIEEVNPGWLDLFEHMLQC